MESIIYQLIDYIRQNMPEVSLVDEDYGQLEAIDKEGVDTYPVTFPCVLIDTPEAEWTGLADRDQKGKAQVNVRLVIDCYDDTHFGSDTMGRILERAAMAERLHALLQCYRVGSEGGAMVREKSRFYTWSHGIKVYESAYTVSLTSHIPATVTVPAPKRVVVTASYAPLRGTRGTAAPCCLQREQGQDSR